MSTKPVPHSPYKAPKKVYDKDAQNIVEEATSPRLNDDEINLIKQIIEGCLYYGRSIGNILLLGVSAIASDQTKATEKKTH